MEDLHDRDDRVPGLVIGGRFIVHLISRLS
jgi:hypothetical protein